MALPADGIWPPPHCKDAYDNYEIWDAWYSGDTSRLASVYGGATSAATSSTSEKSFEPRRHTTGGLVGMWNRFWWGRPISQNTPPVKIHVPLASDIAATFSDLLFAESPKIFIPSEEGEDKTSTEKTDDRLQLILEENGMDSLLLEAGELCSAYSGVFLRINVDQSVTQVPILTAVSPKAAVPEFQWGRLKAVTFWSRLSRDGAKVYRHLERHEPGFILNAVYKGTEEKLGTPVSLDMFDETRGVQPEVKTGTTTLTAQYIPNVKPNRLNVGSDLGRSDYSGIELVMDALDECFTSWMRDIRLGKGRLTVPRTLVEGLGEGKGGNFDTEVEVYSPVETIDNPNVPPLITVSQFAIRSAEHAQTAKALKEEAVSGAGLSPRTMGLQGDAATTATENRFLERKSLNSRSRKIGYVQLALRHYITALLEVDNEWFGSDNAAVPPTIEFPKPMVEDIRQLSETADLLNRAEAASIETLVQLIHPDWDKQNVDEEVAKIMEEKGISVVDPEQAFQQTAGLAANPDAPVSPAIQAPVGESGGL